MATNYFSGRKVNSLLSINDKGFVVPKPDEAQNIINHLPHGHVIDKNLSIYAVQGILNLL